MKGMRFIKTTNQRAVPQPAQCLSKPKPVAYTTGSRDPHEAHFCFAQLPANRPVIAYVGKFYTRTCQD